LRTDKSPYRLQPVELIALATCYPSLLPKDTYPASLRLSIGPFYGLSKEPVHVGDAVTVSTAIIGPLAYNPCIRTVSTLSEYI
jgi:hypothetical protein